MFALKIHNIYLKDTKGVDLITWFKDKRGNIFSFFFFENHYKKAV